MARQYKALKDIGRFKAGDFVGELPEVEIKHHLQLGNIAEVKKEVKKNG